MAQAPTTRLAVFEVLKENGPLHTAAIAEILGMDQRSVNSSVRIAHQRKLLHISGWKRSFGTKGRWGAIYSLGPGQDRKPPQVDPHKQANERYREKYREVLRRRTNARRGRLADHWLQLLRVA
jgi:hypothetical protein